MYDCYHNGYIFNLKIMYVIATKKFRSSRVLLEIILFSHFLSETQMFAGERTATEGVAFAQYRKGRHGDKTSNKRIY